MTSQMQDVLSKFQRNALAIGVLGIAATAAGWAVAGQAQMLHSYLYAYIVWVCLTLGMLGFTLLHHTVRGMWGLPLLRIFEAGAATLPLMVILFIPIVLFLSAIYPWTHLGEGHSGELLKQKAFYLNTPFFLARSAVYFAIWIGLMHTLRRWSLLQDTNGDASLAHKRTNLSAPGLVLFVLTATFAMTDWAMSLEPEWQSSIYGAWLIVGQGLSALSFSVALILLWSKHKPFEGVINPKLMRDWGNLMLAFVVLWAYMSLSQYLIIWSANLPEEIPFYLRRGSGGWQYVGAVLIVLQFFLPFLLLLSSRVKRYSGLLVKVAIGILAMRLLDLFWIVQPAFGLETPRIHWLDVAALLGIGGLWLAWFANMLQRAPLLPRHDSRLQEAWLYEHSAPTIA